MSKSEQLYGTTANRPTVGLYPGRMFYDTTLGSLIVWNGAAWAAVGGGGASCLDGILAYDNAGGTAIPGGAQVPMDTTMLNSDVTNYALSSVVAGALTILNDGYYLLEADLAVTDPGALAHGAWQAVIQTTTSGLGTWANLVGADGYAMGHRQQLLGGAVAQGQARGFVQVSGGGGLDVQLVANVIAASSGAETTFAQASRLSVMRVC